VAADDLHDEDGSEAKGRAMSDQEVGSDDESGSEESKKSSDEEDEDDDASGDESALGEDAAELEVLRQSVAEALQTSTNEPEDEGEEPLMSDNEMLKMDDKLAEIFRLRQGPKTDKKQIQGNHSAFITETC